jgi:hypothetical protein
MNISFNAMGFYSNKNYDMQARRIASITSSTSAYYTPVPISGIAMD